MSTPSARRLVLAAFGLMLAGSALAQPAPGASAASADPATPSASASVDAPVTTLARVVSLRTEPASDMHLRLKLVPRMSYAMQTYKVTDRSQLDGLSEGSWVRFTSRRQGRVEMLDRIEPVPECRRMAVCGSTRTPPAPSVAG
jgi:Cu/Ag efflux protein CusF